MTTQAKHTRILPTDKRGNVYYGPKTVAHAKDAIRNMDAEPAKVVADLRKAGYSRVATLIAKEYGV